MKKVSLSVLVNSEALRRAKELNPNKRGRDVLPGSVNYKVNEFVAAGCPDIELIEERFEDDFHMVDTLLYNSFFEGLYTTRLTRLLVKLINSLKTDRPDLYEIYYSQYAKLF